VTRWLERHRDVISARLDPGESLVVAAGVIATGRRRRRSSGVPTRGFILAVTDRRLVALRASTWRARPGEVLDAWTFDEGAVLARGMFGRIRLVLPDRSVITLAPFGTWSVRHLAR
jgi:hypothetical protein